MTCRRSCRHVFLRSYSSAIRQRIRTSLRLLPMVLRRLRCARGGHARSRSSLRVVRGSSRPLPELARADTRQRAGSAEVLIRSIVLGYRMPFAGGRLDFDYDGMYSRCTRTGKPGESQGRKVTGLTEGSYGRRTAEGSSCAALRVSVHPSQSAHHEPLRSMRGVRYERGVDGSLAKGQSVLSPGE
jgi:hypothetical protein